ncbi:hypothetical protein ABTZ93_39385 [Streptomyces sp. NPDC097941]|uniref:hypothetical protein n=1 Tax=Streptomyces sp. NPDC097941 TaxID=3155685 RepID=UPI0033289249
MDLDRADVALLVSLGGAVGALCNVGIAALTYMRVKSNVRVIVEDHGMSPVAPEPRQERKYRIRIRLKNRGVFAIGVERIDIIPIHGQWWRWWDRKKKRESGQWFPDPKVIGPLSGLKHYANIRPSALRHEGKNPRYVYVKAWLTSGSKVRSAPVKDLSGLVVDIGPDVPAPEPGPPVRRWRRLGLRGR